MNRQETIRDIAKKLLSDGTVKYFIGFERGSDCFAAKPLFAREPEDVDRLVWGLTCVGNTVTYLIDEWKKVPKRGEVPDTRPVGIVVKGCDSRSLALLIQEHILTTDNVHVVGLPCKGMIDPCKAIDAWREMGLQPQSAFEMELEEQGDKILGRWNSQTIEFDMKEIIMEKCKVCRYPNPIIYDDLVGERVEPKKDNYEDILELEAKDNAEKWDFWGREMSKCIRCYACRNVCPVCYCKECSIARTEPIYGPRTPSQEKICKPHWIDKTTTVSDNLSFHLSRMYHMTGRCTNCGECDRVCPVDIPLRLLTRKLEKDMREFFEFEPGISTEPRNLLAEYKEDDPGGFII